MTEVAARIIFELSTEKLVPLNATSYSTYVSHKISTSELERDLTKEGIEYGEYHLVTESHILGPYQVGDDLKMSLYHLHWP